MKKLAFPRRWPFAIAALTLICLALLAAPAARAESAQVGGATYELNKLYLLDPQTGAYQPTAYTDSLLRMPAGEAGAIELRAILRNPPLRPDGQPDDSYGGSGIWSMGANYGRLSLTQRWTRVDGELWQLDATCWARAVGQSNRSGAFSDEFALNLAYNGESRVDFILLDAVMPPAALYIHSAEGDAPHGTTPDNPLLLPPGALLQVYGACELEVAVSVFDNDLSGGAHHLDTVYGDGWNTGAYMDGRVQRSFRASAEGDCRIVVGTNLWAWNAAVYDVIYVRVLPSNRVFVRGGDGDILNPTDPQHPYVIRSGEELNLFAYGAAGLMSTVRDNDLPDGSHHVNRVGYDSFENGRLDFSFVGSVPGDCQIVLGQNIWGGGPVYDTFYVRVIGDSLIRVNNIRLGNKQYAEGEFDDVSTHTATSMLAGRAVNNDPNSRYFVNVGDTLDLSVLKPAAGATFRVVGDNLSTLSVGGGQEGLSGSFLGLIPGSCEVQLVSGNQVLETFYLTVRYPIDVLTPLGEYHKDAVHEYVYTALDWDATDTRYITDPDGNRLYCKNDPFYYVNPRTGEEVIFAHIIRATDTLTLVAYAPLGDTTAFDCSGGVTKLSEERETVTVAGVKLQKITARFSGQETPTGAPVHMITFGPEIFYLRVMNAGANHFDIEIQDGALYTLTENVIYSTGKTAREQTVYDAEIVRIRQCVVYDAQDQVLITIPEGEYWNRNRPEDAQHEFTCAYYTDGKGHLTDASGRLLDEDAVRAGRVAPTPIERPVRIGDVAKVVFTVDLELTPRTRGLIEQRLNVEIPLYAEDIVTASNKCPNHTGLDFAVQLAETAVSVRLEGGKEVAGRDWTDADDGAYSFTLAAVGDAPMPGDVLGGLCQVRNNGRDIEFPDILFREGGEYAYRITEDELDENAPERVSRDETVILVTIRVQDDIKGATVEFSESAKDGKFIFTNPYDAPEEPVGGLKVLKTVSGKGAEEDRAFRFTVTLGDTGVSGVFGGMRFSNGVASFTLRHGESVEAKGLPAGVRYTVAETDAGKDGYVTTASGEVGVIGKDTVAEVRFINAFQEVDEVPRTGDPSPLALWVLLALFAGVGIACVRRKG